MKSYQSYKLIIFMESSAPKPMKIWKPEEEKALLSIIASKSSIDWREIAQELHHLTGSNKTRKQCRERFRNYGRPNVDSAPWSSFEKLALLLSYQLHPHKWSAIAGFLPRRSGLGVKGRFYSAIRKVIKSLKICKTPPNIGKSPIKFYQYFVLSNVILTEYIPYRTLPEPLSQKKKKEKAIISLLSSISEKEVLSFKKKLVDRFKRHSQRRSLPVQLDFDPEELGLSCHLIGELQNASEKFNFPELSTCLAIQIIKKNNEVVINPEQRTLPLPMYYPNQNPLPMVPLFHFTTLSYYIPSSTYFGLPVPFHQFSEPHQLS